MTRSDRKSVWVPGEIICRLENLIQFATCLAVWFPKTGDNSSVPKKQESGDSDGNRILQDQKQKLLQVAELMLLRFIGSFLGKRSFC